MLSFAACVLCASISICHVPANPNVASPSNFVIRSLDCVVEISIGDMFRCGFDTLIFKPEMSDMGSPSMAETITLIVLGPTPTGKTETSNFACSENNVEENPNVVVCASAVCTSPAGRDELTSSDTTPRSIMPVTAEALSGFTIFLDANASIVGGSNPSFDTSGGFSPNPNTPAPIAPPRFFTAGL